MNLQPNLSNSSGGVEMRWVDTYFPFTNPSFELEIYFQVYFALVYDRLIHAFVSSISSSPDVKVQSIMRVSFVVSSDCSIRYYQMCRRVRLYHLLKQFLLLWLKSVKHALDAHIICQLLIM